MSAKRILIVDDGEDIREFMSEMISKLGYEAATAENGDEALRKLKKEKYDLIFLDIMMPAMDGWETLRAIKKEKNLSSIPVVMLTVRRLTGEIRREEMAYVADYITKPFTRQDILTTLKQLGL